MYVTSGKRTVRLGSLQGLYERFPIQKLIRYPYSSYTGRTVHCTREVYTYSMCQPAKFYFYLTVYSVYSMTSLTMCESLLMEELKCGENLPAHTPDVVQLEPMLSPAYRKHVADEYIERKRQMSSEFFSVLVIGFQVCTIHTFIFHNFAVGRSFFCCCLGHACLAENILFNFSCFLRHVFPPRHLLS